MWPLSTVLEGLGGGSGYGVSKGHAHDVASTSTPKPVVPPGGLAHSAAELLNLFKLAADAFAILVPLAWLGFLAGVCRLHGQPVDEGKFAAWRNAIAVLANVLTATFASIVGQLTYEAAHWRLEAGAPLVSLEQLLGTCSVRATITTQMHLCSFNILGTSLLIAWNLSLLGSQAILGSLGSRLDTRKSTIDIAWFDNLHESGFARWRPSSPASFEAYQTWLMYLGFLLSTSVMTPEATKVDPMDQ